MAMCLYVLVKETNVIDVYEINHIRTAEMKSGEEWSSHWLSNKKWSRGAVAERLISAKPELIFNLSFLFFCSKVFSLIILGYSWKKIRLRLVKIVGRDDIWKVRELKILL